MDFNVINEDFVNIYDELSQLNEAEDTSFIDKASEQGLVSYENTLKQKAKEGDRAAKRELQQLKARQSARDKADAKYAARAVGAYTIGYAGVAGGLLGLGALMALAPGAVGALAVTAGAGALANLVVDLIEKAQYNKVTKNKINVQALIAQDPKLKKEIMDLIDKVGKKETTQILAKLDQQLQDHPEILSISEQELEASRDRLAQVIQQTSAEKLNEALNSQAGRLHETLLSDQDEEDAEYSVDNYSAAEQNFCRQYLKDLPNISWLINNDEVSFAICLDELGYAKSFFDDTNAWDKDKEFGFAEKSLDTWKELMLKPVEKDLARLLPKLKQQIQTKGYEQPDEVYVVGARNIFLDGLSETLPHWNPETEGLHEAMLVDDEDEDYSIKDFSATEQNFCRQFLKDFENLSWLIDNDEFSFAVCLDELGYAKRVFSTTNADDEEFGFGAQSLANWKNLMLKPVEDQLARQLPKLKQHIQDKGYDQPEEVYVVGARNLFLDGLRQTLPHWKQ